MIAVILILTAFAVGLIYMTFPDAMSIEKLQRIFKRETQRTDN